jgi:hypothetical protein
MVAEGVGEFAGVSHEEGECVACFEGEVAELGSYGTCSCIMDIRLARRLDPCCEIRKT